MEYVKLGTLVKIQTGKLDANAADENGLYPFFTCSVQPLRINIYEYDCECVLIAGNGDLNIKYYNGKFNAYQRTYIIEAKDINILSVRFLYYFLNKYITKLRANAIGGVIKYIKLGDITSINFPLLSLEEQEKIVARLNKANEIRDKKIEANEKLDELIKSKFVHMFGDPVKNDKGFYIKCLNDFYLDKKSVKCGPFGSALKKHEYSETGIPVWNMDNILPHSEFSSKPNLYITEKKYKELESYNAKENDIIISRAGTVGKMCVLKNIETASIISTNLIRLRLNQEKLLPIWFVKLIEYSGSRICRLKTGSDGAFTHMNTGILDSIYFPYPPIEQQNQFAQFVEKIEEQKSKNEVVIQKMTDLINSIMQKEFNG